MKNLTKVFTKIFALSIIMIFMSYCSSPDKKGSVTAEHETDPDTEEAIKKIDYYVDSKNEGTWMEIVKKEMLAKRKPVLFFTATWCGPCKQFKNSLTDPLMIDALNGVTLIMIDADIDATKDKIGNKYEVSSYPTYIRVDEKGGLIKQTDGGAWDANIPENMAPVLKKFIEN